MKGRLLLNVIVGQCAPVLELFAGENETLLVGRDAAEDVRRLRETKTERYIPFLVLDFRLDIVDGIRRLDLEGDGLSGESLDKDLHYAVW